jgi:hypothetical protein
VVVVLLVELETPEESLGEPLAVEPEPVVEPEPEPVVEPEPEAPIELVLPGVPVEPLVPAVLPLPVVALPEVEGVVVALRSVVVLDVLDEVVGVPVSSRLVQAPSETAATSASAAHVVRDAFIRNSLRGCCVGQKGKDGSHRPTGTLGMPRHVVVGLSRRYL